MNLQLDGATKRHKLSLRFDGRPNPGTPQLPCSTSVLSDSELKRLVAEMID